MRSITQDIEHNLVLWQDPHSGLFGCNAHSTYPGLDGRPAKYPTLHTLVESYYPYYYSVRSDDRNDIVLVGYSNPFDLTARYGTAWMASDAPLWDIYYTYIDESVTFHYLRDDPSLSVDSRAQRGLDSNRFARAGLCQYPTLARPGARIVASVLGLACGFDQTSSRHCQRNRSSFFQTNGDNTD
jgi:hypothetical protein